MSEFIKVATVDQISDPGMMLVEVEDRFVIVVHLDGRFSCIDDVCTHDGGTLSDGTLESGCISCPRHGAKFDVVSGKALTMPATQPTCAHEVRVEGTDILIRINIEED